MMRNILRRQQLQDAWNTVLEHPEWARRLRLLLTQGQRPLPLRDGPSLGVLWSELARRAEAGADISAEAALYLEPPAEFVEAREKRLLAARRSFPHRRVDEWLVRSPQPKLEGLQEVCRRTGVQRVINLRQETQESEPLCRQLGLDYHWIPVADMSVPELSQVWRFIQLFDEPLVSLVHCYAGQGRTGLFVACYRIAGGMEVEAAIAATDAEVNSRGMRPGQRDWVREFARGSGRE